MRNIKKITLSGIFLAIGMILPFFTGQIPEIGRMLLPMHLPVLLCGYVCGWQYGFWVGLILPVLRSILFGMPVLMPKAVVMAAELAIYGFMTGFLYQRLSKNLSGLYLSLLGAMAAGRIVTGIVAVPIYGMTGSSFGMKIYLTDTFLEAIPGIILQLIFIPFLLMTLQKSKIMENTILPDEKREKER